MISRRGLYLKGRRLEYRASDHLEALGYFVLRSAGSHSPVDLVALSTASLNGSTGAHIRLIQVKANCNPTAVERTELRQLRRRLRGLPITFEFWRYNDRDHAPHIEVLR